MAKELIVSVNGREKKIAVLENGHVTEFYIERGEDNSGVVGNIYKGRVQRVLPGMQSAFVEIGLERDAFLYVSDFFDEEEELERIIQEKSKKSEPAEAEREAVEQLQRVRFEREKQMETVQELAEPILSEEIPEEIEEFKGIIESEKEVVTVIVENEQPRGKKGRNNRRGKKPVEPVVEVSEPTFVLEDSGFERIIDDESADIGEMFKDAYIQEAIVDQVRAIEFDMETTSTVEVGSLVIETISGGFERIADEDEEEQVVEKTEAIEVKKEQNKGRNRRNRGKQKNDKSTRSEVPAEASEVVAETEVKAEASEVVAEAKNVPEKVAEASKKQRSAKPKKAVEETENVQETVNKAKPTDKEKAKPAKGKTPAKGKKSTKKSETESASLKEKAEVAEMAVRRGRSGGRGRGRGRNNRPYKQEERYETSEMSETGFKETENVDFQDFRSNGGRRERSQPTIADLLREGQEILVQIAKEPIARKGARITSHISLPGRYLVYMPTVDHTGVSRKIENGNERGRLRNLIQKIRNEEDVPSGGFIVRTAGIGVPEENLRQDVRYLVRTWLDIKKNAEKSKPPSLVHQDLDLVERLLRDQLNEDFTAIRVDSEDEYLRIVEFVNRIQPKMVKNVKLYTRDEPILEAYGVQEEINKAIKPRVWLKSGGYLVINQTEALVAIDVNTGKFVGKGATRLEDTITRTNLEAVEEIARQIRLRDLGGIIVLDLIDMEDRRNRHRVLQALQEQLAGDKSPTKVLSYNDFGLIIMTRKRVKQSLERTLCSPCDYCQGAGWVKSAQTVCYEILDEARRLSKGLDDVRHTTLRVNPVIAKALRNEDRLVLEEIEEYLGNLDLTSDVTIHQEQFDFAFI